MAVGVIIGSAFTAIVTALTNGILKPLINGLLYLLIGNGDATAIYTFLVKNEIDGNVDLASSIYIDWGALVNSIINFILVAFILFIIVRIFNRIKEQNDKLVGEIILEKKAKKEMKKNGLNYKDKKSVEKYILDEQERLKKEQEELDKQKELEEAEAKKHTTEGLLESIKELLENKK